MGEPGLTRRIWAAVPFLPQYGSEPRGASWNMGKGVMPAGTLGLGSGSRAHCATSTGETREEYLERRRASPIHLCRLRYFGNENAWTLAFFTYSDERYSPCVFHSGSDHGAPEEALDVGAIYLPEPRGEVGTKRGRSRPTRR